MSTPARILRRQEAWLGRSWSTTVAVHLSSRMPRRQRMSRWRCGRYTSWMGIAIHHFVVMMGMASREYM